MVIAMVYYHVHPTFPHQQKSNESIVQILYYLQKCKDKKREGRLVSLGGMGCNLQLPAQFLPGL
jgi:hypothetical protein